MNIQKFLDQSISFVNVRRTKDAYLAPKILSHSSVEADRPKISRRPFKGYIHQNTKCKTITCLPSMQPSPSKVSYTVPYA